MTCPTHLKGILFLSVLVVSSCAIAQQSGSSDPSGGSTSAGAIAGALGSNSNPARDSERISGRADEGKTIEFKLQTSLVQVPVIVTDRAGQHIHALAKTDFKILDNGKPQNIANFEEIIPAKGLVSIASPPAGTFTNITSDES